MSEPDEIRFACIGCGTLNPVGSETCSGCGHPFGGPVPARLPDPPAPPGPPPERRPSPSLNPYEPPPEPPRGPPTFRIGTAMAIIAVIAVNLAAFAADASFGVFASIGLVPASIRLALVASRRAGERRPMPASDQLTSFLLTFLSSYLVMVSALIAFGLTCFPVGLTSGNIGVAVVVGLVVGVVFAGWVARLLVRAARAKEEARRHDSRIWWR